MNNEEICGTKNKANYDTPANMIKKLKFLHSDIGEISQAAYEPTHTSEAIADLRDYCIQQDHPLPQFQDVQHGGPLNAPEFTALCRVSTIVRYATSSTRKGAKQLAAQAILKILQQIFEDSTQIEDTITTIDEEMRDDQAANQKIIKTYRECVESDVKKVPGTLLCDRHNYFKNLNVDLRRNAHKVLHDTNIISHKEKVHLLLNELKIEYKEWMEPAETWGSMILFELLCDLDVLFAGKRDEIYLEILDYFSDML